MAHLIKEMASLMFFFKMASQLFLGSHRWLKGQDGLRKYQRSFCYIFDARFNRKWHFIWLCVSSISRDATFSCFEYGVGSHFGQPWSWIGSQARPKIQLIPYYIRSVKPELVENDTFIGFNSPCGWEKSLFMYLSMASEATFGQPSWI